MGNFEKTKNAFWKIQTEKFNPHIYWWNQRPEEFGFTGQVRSQEN